MNAALIGLYRSELQRQHAPAVVAASDRQAKEIKGLSRPARIWLAWSRELSQCLEVAIIAVALKNTGPEAVMLFNNGHKYREVEDELIGAGVGEGAIGVVASKYREIMRETRFRLYWILLKVLTLRLGLRVRASRRFRSHVHAISFYIFMKQELALIKRRCWVILGDLSPHLIALAAAARASGHACMSWQCDYLDFKYFPGRSDIAAVLNGRGIELAGHERDSSGVVWRAAPEPEAVVVEEKPDSLGVLLNAFAGAEELRVLDEIQARLGITMEIRLHPRSTLSEDLLSHGLSFAPSAESLEEFARRMPLVICSNTSSQLKVLCHGTPVVQIPGLDNLRFDHHGYVEKGIVLGIRDLESLDLDAVGEFYQSSGYLAALRKLLGPAASQRHPTIREGIEGGLFERIGIAYSP